jgi:hypothetical protein
MFETVMGGALAWLVGLGSARFVPEMPGSASLRMSVAAAAGALLGFSVGWAQALALRPHVRRALLWAPANALAWALGAVAASSLFAGIAAERPGSALLSAAAGAVVLGVVAGVLTGAALVLLLRHPLAPRAVGRRPEAISAVVGVALALALAAAGPGCRVVGPPPPPPDWAACDGPGQCLALETGCCGVCGAPTLADVAGVNAERIDAFFADTCRDPNPICPDCASMLEPNLVGFCLAAECRAVDVRLDPLSACAADDDCMLRAPGCCEACAPSPWELVAIAVARAGDYRDLVCPADAGCPACAPIYPPGWAAACGASGHCAVVERPVCPADPPGYGESCTSEGLACEYGLDLRVGCRTHATCTAGVWELAISGCPPMPGPGEDGCPPVPPAGGLCASDGLVCDMGGGTVCACAQCAGGPCTLDPRWTCAGPPGTPGCPAVAPPLGSACVETGLACIYGVCSTSTSAGRRCSDAAWRDEPVMCPL